MGSEGTNIRVVLKSSYGKRERSDDEKSSAQLGRVSGIYDPQGSTRYGRSGSLTGGQTYHNSYTNLDKVVLMYVQPFWCKHILKICPKIVQNLCPV